MNPHTPPPLTVTPDWVALRQRITMASSVCVAVERHEGSVPRERGAWMLVFANGSAGSQISRAGSAYGMDAIEGTIGGGHLEHEAIGIAQAMLSDEAAPRSRPTIRRFALGPALGQCCGGVVWLSFEVWTAAQDLEGDSLSCQSQAAQRIERLQNLGLRLPTLALFGGGHVGRAIVSVMSGLPMRLHWIDSRDEIFPTDLPSHVVCEHSAPVQAAVQDLTLVPSGSRLLIMSFSHAEDLEICAAALLRQRMRADLSFVGLIGSKTKWATFQRRLQARGFTPDELAQITCPIGLTGIEGKEPSVIAVACAAQILRLPTMTSTDQGIPNVLA